MVVRPRGYKTLASNLAAERDEALLYVELATLRTDVALAEDLDDLRWRGAQRTTLQAMCDRLGDDSVMERVRLWR